jgi:hypothetical protein
MVVEGQLNSEINLIRKLKHDIFWIYLYCYPTSVIQVCAQSDTPDTALSLQWLANLCQSHTGNSCPLFDFCEDIRTALRSWLLNVNSSLFSSLCPLSFLCFLHAALLPLVFDSHTYILTHTFLVLGGKRWRNWLRHCPSCRKVAGSIPGDVIGIFNWHNPSGRTMTLGLTQPLTEMSTRNISCGVKMHTADNFTTFMCWLSWNLGASASWNLQGLYRPVMGLLYLFALLFHEKFMYYVLTSVW